MKFTLNDLVGQVRESLTFLNHDYDSVIKRFYEQLHEMTPKEREEFMLELVTMLMKIVKVHGWESRLTHYAFGSCDVVEQDMEAILNSVASTIKTGEAPYGSPDEEQDIIEAWWGTKHYDNYKNT